jgi:hypothetical protein
MKQLDLFSPTPAISGKTNGSGQDVYYCKRRLVWTTDPEDLGLDDEELRRKYGPSVKPPEGADLSYWQKFGYWFALGGEEP